MHEVSITVNGQRYLGWKDVIVQRSLDALCGTFDLSYTDAWNFTNRDNAKWYLKPGDECEVYVDEDLVLTGYIDRANASFDGNAKNFSVGGRDKTQDLVDCSASVDKFVDFKKVSIAQMARTLCAPFGLSVSVETSLGEPFARIALNNGERAFNVLDRMAKQRGLLLSTNEEGSLVITSIAQSRSDVALVEGENVLSASIGMDHRNRYSIYYVYGQNRGDELLNGPQANKPFSVARDSGVRRFRPRVVTNEGNTTTNAAQKRAQWEAAYNAAQGTQISVQVNLWRKGESTSSPLWKPNELVEVELPSLNYSGELLVQGVAYRLSESSGIVADLTLTRKDAWVPQPDLSFSEEVEFDIGEIVD